MILLGWIWKTVSRISRLALFQWIWRVLKKGIWMLALLPQLLDLIYTYNMPTQSLPSWLSKLFDQGLSWHLSVLLAALALLASAYWVHLEDRRESLRRLSTLQALRDSQPNLELAFQDQGQHFTTRLQILLDPLPAETGVDQLVEQERKTLLAKRSSSAADGITTHAAAFANPNYEQQVEQYLVDYRDYRIRRYERAIERARPAYPVLYNSGPSEATNISLEFRMPPTYRIPAEYQCQGSSSLEQDLVEAGLSAQEAQEEAAAIMCVKPTEPNPVALLSSRSYVPFLGEDRPLFSPLQPFRPYLEDLSSPAYDERDGRWYVTYELERLVPDEKETDFAPFWCWLGDVRHSVMWHVPVTIRATELREPVEQVLTLDIQVLPE